MQRAESENSQIPGARAVLPHTYCGSSPAKTRASRWTRSEFVGIVKWISFFWKLEQRYLLVDQFTNCVLFNNKFGLRRPQNGPDFIKRQTLNIHRWKMLIEISSRPHQLATSTSQNERARRTPLPTTLPQPLWCSLHWRACQWSSTSCTRMSME